MSRFRTPVWDQVSDLVGRPKGPQSPTRAAVLTGSLRLRSGQAPTRSHTDKI